MDIHRKEMTVPFSLKTHGEDDGFYTYSGYASIYDHMDSDRDIIRPGAFVDSIAELQASGKKLPALWQHQMDMPIGVYNEITESEKGLFVKASLPRDDSFVSGRVMPQLRIKSVASMSVGFILQEWEDDGKNRVRNITKGRLMEVSLATFPANDGAIITEVKSVVPYQDLPLAGRDRSWDSTAALRRVRTWAGMESPSDLEDASVQRKYRQAFLWYDRGSPALVGSYKLPIATVVDGTLTAVPRGIFAAAGVMRGARGGVDIPDSDRDAIVRHLERYYKKMGLDSPFEKSFRIDDFGVYDERTLEHMLKDGVSFSNKMSKQIISGLKSIGLRDVVDDHRDDANVASEVLSAIDEKLNAILQGA
jgi:HK97 family phage prohead protease